MTDLTAAVADAVGLSVRGLVAVLVVAGMFVVSHLAMPAATPEYAVYGRYATYLAVFCVWMAWFVDWLAVRLGQDAHPSEESR
jgi:hypothetical protein